MSYPKKKLKENEPLREKVPFSCGKNSFASATFSSMLVFLLCNMYLCELKLCTVSHANAVKRIQ